MLFAAAALFASLAAAAPAGANLTSQYVTRNGTQLMLGGKPWSAHGANVYWLGIDENVVPPAGQPYAAPASYPTKGRITEIMNVLNTMGAHTIRSQTLGVSVGHPLSLEPALNQFNEAAFDTIDWAVYEAKRHGLRIYAPLVDNYDYYHGGKFDFLRFRGINISSSATPIDSRVQEFYNNATIVGDFKAYIHKLLTHVNPYTGMSYADDPTIFAYETGNELGGPVFGDKAVPAAWTDEICSYIKQLGPKKLCLDGTYGIGEGLNLSSVDIVSDHYYPLDLDKLNSDLAISSAASKAYVAGEYAWTATTGVSLQAFFDVIESKKSIIAGDLFWSLFGHNVPDCTTYVDHDDGFTMHYGDKNNSAVTNSQISTIRRHFFRMQGKNVTSTLPAVACPGPQ